MKVLFLSSSVPFPSNAGGKLRTAGIVNALSKTNDLYFLALHDPEKPADLKTLKKYVKDFQLVEHKPRFKWDDPFYKKALKVFLALLGIPSPVIRDYSPEFSRTVKDYFEEINPDIVVVDFPWLGRYLYQLKKGFRKVLISHNIESEVFWTTRKGPVFWLLWKIWRRYESRMLRIFDLILVTSKAERKGFLKLWPGGNYVVVPNAVDTKFLKFHPYRKRSGLVFTGTLHYLPNVDAVKFFVSDIFPLIREKMPEIQFDIVGSDPVPSIAALGKLPGVRVFANVPDIRPYIAGASVAVVPVRSGSGTRLKILEAFALGTPVVSTAFGAAGLDVAPGSDILFADRPENFASAVVSLLNDRNRAKRIAVSAREVVESKYSWKMVSEKVDQAMDKL